MEKDKFNWYVRCLWNARHSDEITKILQEYEQALHQPPVVGRIEQLRAFKEFLQSEYHLPVSNRMIDEFEQKQNVQ
jgi:hypothetical protein